MGDLSACKSKRTLKQLLTVNSVLLVCAGLITLLVIIYKGHSPSLVRARSQEELEVVFACTLCYTGLTDEAHRSNRCSLLRVKFRQPSHEFTFGVGMSFISYPLVLNPLV
jgi:hypothetical protein